MNSNQIDKSDSLQKLKNQEYKNKIEIIEIVKQIVQPEVNEAIIKLIKKLSTISVVQSYSEQIQSQKLQDKKEQKKHEKERLKFELGSEYESSEESNAMDDYGDYDVYKQNDDSDNDDNDAIDKNFEIVINKDKPEVSQIKEEEDIDYEENQFLGLALKEIIGQPVTFLEQKLECYQEKTEQPQSEHQQNSALPFELDIKEENQSDQPQDTKEEEEEQESDQPQITQEELELDHHQDLVNLSEIKSTT